MTEHIHKGKELAAALENINGEEIELRINALAEISYGGNIGEGGNRLAFIPLEKDARHYLKNLLTLAGADDIQEHAGGIAALYLGANPKLPAVGIGSHFDTVPKAGKYDGPFGTLAAISVIEAFKKAGIKPKRNVIVLAFTNEEASRFNINLVGSRAMFHGLTDDILQMKDMEGISIQEAMSLLGFDPDATKKPIFRKENFDCWFEAHIEQGDKLAKEGLDVASVDSIASPDRRKIEIGRPLKRIGIEDKFVRGLRVTVRAKGGHSGGTPMGKEHRADGLRPIADLMMASTAILENKFEKPNAKLYFGKVDIKQAALNKIPGESELTIFISANEEENAKIAQERIVAYIEQINSRYGQASFSQFSEKPIDIEDCDLSSNTILFEPSEILPSFKSAGRVISNVERICQKFRDKNVVGTVGTFNISPDGIIKLGLDVRGIDPVSRGAAVEEILIMLENVAKKESVELHSSQLVGSYDPTVLDPGLVTEIQETGKNLGLKIGRVFSAAGHDTQSIAAIGIKSGMIFIPSRNGGISHHPDEYSTPQDLENGAKLLAAVVYREASKSS